jgi:GNAT superfamily N-acetyltransferase
LTVELRRIADDGDLAVLASIVNATTPDEPTSLDLLRWQDRTYPGGVRSLAIVDGRPVGAATIGRIYMYPPDYDALWGTLNVLPEARRRGVGSALLEAVARVARDADKGYLHVPVSEARPDAVAFLEHRGFAEFERQKIVRLDLVDHQAPLLDVPDGVALTTLAERPDLVPGIHAVALETFADIPGGDQPMAVGDLAEFRARDVDPLPTWGFIVATDAATGDVVGYASLYARPDGTTVGWHDMTAVAPAWRGRGLATALKTATIRAAIEHGWTALETGNDVENAPMRAVNARLGYRPLPDAMTMRGPATPASAEAPPTGA